MHNSGTFEKGYTVTELQKGQLKWSEQGAWMFFFLQEKKKLEHLKRFSLEKSDLDMIKVCDFMHGLEKNNGHISSLLSEH